MELQNAPLKYALLLLGLFLIYPWSVINCSLVRLADSENYRQ